MKNKALSPEPKFQNLTSLKYLENDALIYFQEGSGKDVDEFWKKVDEINIPLKRGNKLAKIFKRGKIKNEIEYDFVIDTYNSYIESNSFSETEIKKLNEMIFQFENGK